MVETSTAVRRDARGDLRLHGVASAHSHAFQRALRGRTQRRAREGEGSFFQWRGLMYALAEGLDPEAIFALSRFAFLELASAGVSAVGEFHYLHHQPDGRPYEERTLLADRVIAAAREVGLRITLLRVLYQRAGFGRALEGAQRRFSDASLERALADVEALLARHAHDPGVRIGLAPHSLRAVPGAWLKEIAAFAEARDLPLHMHVSEQPREIRECLAEHGLRPVELLHREGLLGPRFSAVHATHLSASEARLLGGSGATVCLCRSTERDLGDGLPAVGPLARAGARFSIGADSHALSDPFEEARAIELDERSRTGARASALEAPALLRALGPEGYASLGLGGLEGEDAVTLDGGALELAGADPERLEDAVIFGANPRCVRQVEVGGRALLEEGCHPLREEARAAFEATLRRLGLR